MIKEEIRTERTSPERRDLRRRDSFAQDKPGLSGMDLADESLTPKARDEQVRVYLGSVGYRASPTSLI